MKIEKKNRFQNEWVRLENKFKKLLTNNINYLSEAELKLFLRDENTIGKKYSKKKAKPIRL